MRGRSHRSADVVSLAAWKSGRPREIDAQALCVLEVVARSFAVPTDLMLGRSRPSDVARARHVAAYLIHTCLHRNIVETAKVFGRDRTTASYACARVEEQREDPAFDAELCRLEAAIADTVVEVRRAAG